MIPSKEQQKHFEEQGYLVLKDVLSDHLVSSLAKLCELSNTYHEKYSSQYFVDRTEKNFFVKYETAKRIANDQNIDLLPMNEWCHRTIYYQEGYEKEPEVLEYITELNKTIGIYEFIAKLLHSTYLQFYNAQLWKKHARSCDPTEIHRDYTAFDMMGLKSACAWISPEPVRHEHSAFQVIPGSHKGVDHTTKHWIDKDYYARDNYNLVTLEIEPKDIIIIDLRLSHAATPNISDVDRYAMTLRYLGDDLRYYNRPQKHRFGARAEISDGELYPIGRHPIIWNTNEDH